MSLLGPDDFGLGRRGRMRKLARDLSPELQREVDRLLDEFDEEEALSRLSKELGPAEAHRLLADARRRSRRRRGAQQEH